MGYLRTPLRFWEHDVECYQSNWKSKNLESNQATKWNHFMSVLDKLKLKQLHTSIIMLPSLSVFAQRAPPRTEMDKIVDNRN